MVKSHNQRKHPKKVTKNKRIRKKITLKTITNSPSEKSAKNDINSNLYDINNITNSKDNLNLTVINWIFNFVKNSPYLEKDNNEFIPNLISIIRNLYMNKNEFIVWTLLIEFFQKNCKNNINIEILFYIGILSKEKFIPNFSQTINQSIDTIKFNEIKNILKTKSISIIEFNQKFKYFSSLSNHKTQKKIFIQKDYDKMVNYIVSEHLIKEQSSNKKDKVKINKKVKEKVKENKNSIKISCNMNDNVIWTLDDKNEINNINNIINIPKNEKQISNSIPKDESINGEKNSINNINDNNTSEKQKNIKDNNISENCSLKKNLSEENNNDNKEDDYMNEEPIRMVNYDNDNPFTSSYQWKNKFYSSNNDNNISDFNFINLILE